DLVETHFTARMEDGLDEIADGKAAWDDLVGSFFRGQDESPGLQKRVEDGEIIYPAIELGKDPETGQDILVKIGKEARPYLRRGEGEGRLTASVPEDLPPDELTLDKALQLLRSRSDDLPPIGEDPDSGLDIFLKTGRFGDYLELAQTEEEKESKAKPRRVSLPRGLKPEDVTAEIAVKLIKLPRLVGPHPEDGEDVTTAIGRYGPFIRHGKETRSLSSWEEACDIAMEQALEILAKPKARGRQQKKVLKELEGVKDAEGPVQVLEGRYGPYVSDGKTNASLPRGADPEQVTPEQASELLEKRRNAPKKPRRKRRR
ncbi:MAG: topoisomerase C-terminal repeat-containing protein, partial [Acidobacteriota bacterium]